MREQASNSSFISTLEFGRETAVVTGSGKVNIVKNDENHIARAIYSPINGNISIKAVRDSEAEYRTYAVVIGLNSFGVMFNKVDIAASMSLANVVFIL